MKKILSLFLVLIMALATVACKSKEKQSAHEEIPEVIKTDKLLLQDGKTDYVVVLPENSNAMENIAAEEFVSIFKESTLNTLEIVKDTGLAFDETKQFISIGNTSLVSDSGLVVPEEAKGVNAYTIQTVGESIFCVGGTEYGVVYGVYELLYRMLNFEQFYTDCYTLDKGVTNLTLDIYNITHSPDILRKVGSDGFMASNPIVARRMRAPYTYQSMNMGMGEISTTGHNTLDYLPHNTYGEEYGEYWYDNATNPKQLCWTSHGDSEKYEIMVNTFADRMKEVIKHNYGSGKQFLYVSNMDDFSSCGCDACVEMYKKYGCDTGAFIIFVNKVYDIVMDWMRTDEEGKNYLIEDFTIRISAYYKFERPPVRYDETLQKWVPIDDEVILRDGVIPGISPIFTNFTKSVYDEQNKTYLDMFNGWAAISSSLSFWLYCTNFNHYMYPFESYNYMQEYYQLLADLGTVALNDQTQNGNNGGMTGFHILKSYLSSKLAYDVNADMNELIDRFFNAYFGEASEDMLKFFNSVRAFFQYQQNEFGLYSGTKPVQDKVEVQAFWPKHIIDTWQGYVADALEKIEAVKYTDVERYEMLYKHITCERIFLDHVYIQFYSSELGSELSKYVNRIIEDIELNNINRIAEGRLVSAYINDIKGKI